MHRLMALILNMNCIRPYKVNAVPIETSTS